MGKQANILSFDEAKRDINARRPSSAAPNAHARRKSSGSASSARLVRPVSARQMLADEWDGASAEEEFMPEKRSRSEERHRRRQKARAEKKFEKQFGGSKGSRSSSASSGASDADSGPRAAVYKGQMGSKQKRATRMQNESSPNASAKRGFSSHLSNWKSSPKFITGAAFMLCLVLTCGFLYTPVQQFYHSVRERDRLQAEYVALEQRNESLQSEVKSLTTDSGVQDRAREQFGWVSQGEQAGAVKGLSSDEEESSNFTANIVPGSVPAPETWYSPVLDALFGVS